MVGLVGAVFAGAGTVVRPRDSHSGIGRSYAVGWRAGLRYPGLIKGRRRSVGPRFGRRPCGEFRDAGLRSRYGGPPSVLLGTVRKNLGCRPHHQPPMD